MELKISEACDRFFKLTSLRASVMFLENGIYDGTIDFFGLLFQP